MPLGSLVLGGVGDFSAENSRGNERSMAALEPVCTVGRDINAEIARRDGE